MVESFSTEASSGILFGLILIYETWRTFPFPGTIQPGNV
jgi:hypothetical protein